MLPFVKVAALLGGCTARSNAGSTAKPRAGASNPDKRSLRFAVIGDCGAGTEPQRKVAQRLEIEKPQYVLIPGDIAYDYGRQADYDAHFFPYYRKLMTMTTFLPVLGNHDVGDKKERGSVYTKVWHLPDNGPSLQGKTYALNSRRSNNSQGVIPEAEAKERNYSVDAGPCHFAGIDTTADRATLETVIVPWLRQDLAAAKARGAKWRIVFFHHPPYTHGAYRDNSLQWSDIRNLVVPVLHEAGVRLVFSGHDHNYQHMWKDGINFVITGEGGARLYTVKPDYTAPGLPPLLAWNDSIHSYTLCDVSASGDSLRLRQIDENGKELDRFELTQ
jgi:3',5'-cyclic AMP phosphodiesterase CpdA